MRAVIVRTCTGYASKFGLGGSLGGGDFAYAWAGILVVGARSRAPKNMRVDPRSAAFGSYETFADAEGDSGPAFIGADKNAVRHRAWAW